MMNPNKCELEKIVLELKKRHDIPIRENVFGSSVTTFSIGGPLRYLIEPLNIEQLSLCLKSFYDRNLTVRILGAGSNLLISDQGIPGVIFRLGRGFNFIKIQSESRFEIGASTSLMTTSRKLSNDGFSGLEFSGGIPASIGGAIYMNAGAHGSEIATVLNSICIALENGSIERIHRSELVFSYRKTSIPDRAVVVSGEFDLVKGDKEKSSVLRASYLKERRMKQPLTFPCAGSVFKNPSKEHPAGLLLDKAGLKGVSHGGAKFSELHANWIVNVEKKARAEDVIFLLSAARARVYEKFGVSLEKEIVEWI